MDSTRKDLDKIDKRLRVIESWLLDHIIEKQKEREYVNAVLERAKSDSAIMHPRKSNE